MQSENEKVLFKSLIITEKVLFHDFDNLKAYLNIITKSDLYNI